MVLFLAGRALGLQLRENTGTSQTDTGPSHEGKAVSLEENGQQDRKDLSGGGDGGQDERVKVGNGVKDE